MSIAILKEDFEDASKEYSRFQNALLDKFKNDPIMENAIGHLNELACAYSDAKLAIYQAGLTLDEVLNYGKSENS